MCSGRRALQLVLLSVLVATTLAAPPLQAAQADRPAAPAISTTAAPVSGCATDLMAELTLAAPTHAAQTREAPTCKLAAVAAAEPTPTTKSCIVGVTCTKHCACTCSQIKDCNVNSDCSNGRCFSGISCC